MPISAKDAKAIHAAIHGGKASVKLSDGAVLPVVEKSKIRRVQVGAVRAMEQNKSKASVWSKKAKAGARITWFLCGSPWGRIVDGTIESHGRAIVSDDSARTAAGKETNGAVVKKKPATATAAPTLRKRPTVAGEPEKHKLCKLDDGDHSITVCAARADGLEIHVDIRSSSVVEELVKKVALQLKVKPSLVSLLHGAVLLDEAETLATCGIRSGAMVTVVIEDPKSWGLKKIRKLREVFLESQGSVTNDRLPKESFLVKDLHYKPQELHEKAFGPNPKLPAGYAVPDQLEQLLELGKVWHAFFDLGQHLILYLQRDDRDKAWMKIGKVIEHADGGWFWEADFLLNVKADSKDFGSTRVRITGELLCDLEDDELEDTFTHAPFDKFLDFVKYWCDKSLEDDFDAVTEPIRKIVAKHER